MMLSAAELLRSRGSRVACVTNDQGSQLVDSKMVLKKEIPLQQIEGGCFCCRFDELVDSINEIITRHRPDVILAEAVGSCTDLAATVVKPLQSFHGDLLKVLPLTAVADPIRLSEHLSQTSHFSPEISYVFQKQLEEARYIVLNKSDTLSDHEVNHLCDQLGNTYHNSDPIPLSALTANGVERWIQKLFIEDVFRPVHVLDIDYDTYAEGESHLGWLNAGVTIEGKIDHADELCLAMFGALVTGLSERGAQIAHCKLWAQDDRMEFKVSAVNNHAITVDRSPAEAWSSERLTLWLNARVYSVPEQLLHVFEETMRGIKERYAVRVDVKQADCFAPSRPVPTYRIV